MPGRRPAARGAPPPAAAAAGNGGAAPRPAAPRPRGRAPPPPPRRPSSDAEPSSSSSSSDAASAPFLSAAAGASPAADDAAAREEEILLHYHTEWPAPALHYSFAGGPWRRSPPMAPVASGGGRWHALRLPLPPAGLNANAGGAASTSESTSDSAGAPLLEFVVTDGADAWDKAAGGANYAARAPGRWALAGGALGRPVAPPLLLVSDLDGTLVSSEGGGNADTAAFAAWWAAAAVPAGSRLVYNTGRALDLFEELAAAKAGLLPRPDALIASVGTKVYWNRAKREGSNGGGGHNKNGSSNGSNGSASSNAAAHRDGLACEWEEDAAYGAALAAGWDLEAAREAAYAALAAAGREAVHFRAASEMNEFKITLGAKAEVLESVLECIGSALNKAGVAHRLIVSGAGDWRYVDLVPAGAGKLAALEHVRGALCFAPAATVAAGDSGNDLDMLRTEGVGHAAIVVGNAQPDLLAWARAEAAAAAAGARAGPVLARAPAAAGVLEGLAELGFRLEDEDAEAEAAAEGGR
jgi:hydroxymethylpyrimidine pyrophosphatase-like HAD family hydrolase